MRLGASDRFYRYCAWGPVATCAGAGGHRLCLLEHPDDGMSSILLERRCDTGSTVFCTMYAKQDWHQRGSVIHADAVMDRIVSNTLWIDTGTHDIREYAVANQ